MKATNGRLAGCRAGWVTWLAAVGVGMLGPDAVGQVPQGDYGDAPDEGPTHYDLMFETSSPVGYFPTLYHTTNARIYAHGIHHSDTSQEWFGPMDAPPSRETDANDTTTDEDGWPNLINSDMRDNGLPEIPFFISLTQYPPIATLSFYVSVPAGAPDVDRVFNLLIDWDQDGRWKDMGLHVPAAVDEWAVKNQVVRVAPGETRLIQSHQFQWGWHRLLSPLCCWMRMTLTQIPVQQPAPDGWDGSGSFPTGETEDYLLHDRYDRDVEGGPWDPDNPNSLRPQRPRGRPGAGFGPIPPPPGGGGVKPAGKKPARPALKPSVVILPGRQTVEHGTSVLAQVVKQPSTDPPADPLLPAWEVLPGWWNATMNPPSGALPTTPGTAHPVGPVLDSATWSTPINGPAGTLATIIVTSALDPRTPAIEDRTLAVNYEFPGAISGTAFGTVSIRHSQLYSPGTVTEPGLPGVYLGGTWIIGESGISEPEKTTAFDLMDGSRVDFESGQLPDALAKLAALQGMLGAALPGITPEEEARLTSITTFLDAEISAIETTHGAVPVPVIEWPPDGAPVAGMIELLVTHLYPVGEVNELISERRDPVTGDWLPLPLLPTHVSPASNEWLQALDTTTLPDGIQALRVTLVDEHIDPSPTDDRMGRAMVIVNVDNTPPPVPMVTFPANGTPITGLLHVEAVGGAGDACVASLEIRPTGSPDWNETATDYYGTDGWQFDVNLGKLPGGPYELRVVSSDAAENEAASELFEVILEPAYLAWRQSLGIADDNDDSDGDGIPAILEYYAGLDPQVAEPTALLDFGIGGSPGGFFLHCARREHVAGLRCTVELSSDLGITDPWMPLAIDPPAGPPGRIEVALPDGGRKFGRLRLDP